MSDIDRARIVVGMEGSGGAKAALRWALREAAFRDAAVEVLTAYSNTYVPASPDFNYVPLEASDLEKEVHRMQDTVVDEVLAEPEIDSSVEVVRTVRRGRAADTLIAAGDTAAMLVVGSRGRGGFRGLLLGSVSQQIVHHAACPVVIVRPDLF